MTSPLNMANTDAFQGVVSEPPLDATQSRSSPTEASDTHEDASASDDSSGSNSSYKEPERKIRAFLPNSVSEDPELNARWRIRNSKSPRIGSYLDVVFQELRDAIIGFAHKALPHAVTRDMFDSEVKARLSWIAQDKVEFYIERCCYQSSEGSFAGYFFEAWIWNMLYDNLFSRDSRDKWRPGPWANFGAILYNMQDKVQHVENGFTSAFFASRQLTALVLELHHGQHSDPSWLKTIIQQTFGSFILARDPSYTTLEAALNELVDAALELDISVLSTRLDARVEMADPDTGLRHGFGFNEDSQYMTVNDMFAREISQPLHGRTVELVNYPMIRVHGKEDPESTLDSHVRLLTDHMVTNYPTETVYDRMGVVIGGEFVDPFPPRKQQPVDEQQAQVGEDNEDGGDEGGGDIHGDGDDEGRDAAEYDDDDDDDDGYADKTGDSDGQLPDSPKHQLADNDQQQLSDDDEGFDAAQPAGEWSVNAQPETNGQPDTDQQTHGHGHAGHMEQEAEPRATKYRLRRQKRVDYTFVGMANKRRLV